MEAILTLMRFVELSSQAILMQATSHIKQKTIAGWNIGDFQVGGSATSYFTDVL